MWALARSRCWRWRAPPRSRPAPTQAPRSSTRRRPASAPRRSSTSHRPLARSTSAPTSISCCVVATPSGRATTSLAALMLICAKLAPPARRQAHTTHQSVSTSSSSDLALPLSLCSGLLCKIPDDANGWDVCSLFSLYNQLASPSGKALVYRKAIELAAVGKAADCVVPTFKNIDAFVAYWGISKPEQRELSSIHVA